MTLVLTNVTSVPSNIIIKIKKTLNEIIVWSYVIMILLNAKSKPSNVSKK